MIRIKSVRPLEGRTVHLTLTDDSIVDRDLSGLLDGWGVFERISFDDGLSGGIRRLRDPGVARRGRHSA